MTQNETKIESFDGPSLHPSLDINNGLLILGFRYRSGPGEERELFVVCKNQNIYIYHEPVFELDGVTYFIDKRGRKLEFIENKWSSKELKLFFEKYSSGGTGLIPDPRILFADIETIFKNFVDLEIEIDYTLLTAWTIGTYCFPIFSAYPFLNIKAPKRSGKSQCLNLLKNLAFNAIKARPSLASLSDTVDSLRGTYLIDQADSLSRNGSEDLLDILTDSYKKGGGKRRVVNFDKKRGREVLEFETYSPKCFASIKELPEDLKDRCLIIPLIRSSKNFLDPETNQNWAETRAKVYKFILGTYSAIEGQYVATRIGFNQNREIVGRELELWLPIEVLLKCAGFEDKIPEAKKRFFDQYDFSQYEPSEIEESVVKTILNHVADKNEVVLTPKEISAEIYPEYLSEGINKETVKIGWAIKKFNLASEKLPRTKDGVRYLFKRERVQKIYDSYFKSSVLPTSPAPEPEKPDAQGILENVGF